MMIGRTDKAEVTFEGKRQQIIFNLAEPLNFVSSASHAGIQVADVFASGLAFALRNPTEEISRTWMRLLDESISEFSVFPDPERIDLNSEIGFVNRVILHELVERSQRKVDLFVGMPQLISQAATYWRRHTLLGDL